jgi:hypothetical protein
VAQIDVLLAPAAAVAVGDGQRMAGSNTASAGTSRSQLRVRRCPLSACELGSQAAADCPA